VYQDTDNGAVKNEFTVSVHAVNQFWLWGVFFGVVKTTHAEYTVVLAGVQVIPRSCVGKTLFGLNVGKVIRVYVFLAIGIA